MRNATLTAPLALTREFTFHCPAYTVANICEAIMDNMFPGMERASDLHSELYEEITDTYFNDMTLTAADLVRCYGSDDHLREDTAARVITETPLAFQSVDVDLLKSIRANDDRDFSIFADEGISDDVLMVACDFMVKAYEITPDGSLKVRVSVETF